MGKHRHHVSPNKVCPICNILVGTARRICLGCGHEFYQSRISEDRRRLNSLSGSAFRRIPVPTRAHPLIINLVHLMNARQVPITVMCKRAGISINTFQGWRYNGKSPLVPSLEACFNIVGRTLMDVPMPGAWIDGAELHVRGAVSDNGTGSETQA